MCQLGLFLFMWNAIAFPEALTNTSTYISPARSGSHHQTSCHLGKSRFYSLLLSLLKGN